MQPAHDRSHGNVQDFGDFLVGEALHIGQKHRDPVLLGQRLQSAHDLRLGDRLHEHVFGTGPQSGLGVAPQPLVQVQILYAGQVHRPRFALLAPVGVDESIGEDAEQPGSQVGALLEVAESPVGPQVGLLHQVFGVGGVAGHPPGR